MQYYPNIYQPSFATLGEKYKLCNLGKYGIINIYSVQVDSGCNQEDICVIPDGATDILFLRRANGNICIYSDGSPLQPIAMKTRLNLAPGDVLFGVRMFPNIMRIISGMTASDTINNIISLKEDKKLETWGRRIFSVETFQERVSVFLNYYISVYYKEYRENVQNNRLAEYMLNEISKSNGTLRIKDLSEDAGYSIQYMNRVFSSEYGLAPKKYGRIMRVQAVIQELMTDKRIVDISEEVNMSEVNLIREFKTMLHYTPGEYRNILNNYQQRLLIQKQ